MAAAEHVIPFGMRDIKITPYTTGETLSATGSDVPAARVLSWSDSESFTDLRGDDGIITRRGSGPDVSWSMESGGVRLLVFQAMMGHTLSSSGTTPSTVKTLRRKKTDVRPFFQAEGQALSDSGGDVHSILYKCRVSEGVDFAMQDGEFTLYNPSGVALPLVAARTGPPTVDIDTIYDLIYNETATSITGT